MEGRYDSRKQQPMIENMMTLQPDILYEDLKSASEVAQLFKKTRSDLGLTISQVSDDTKIRKVWLNCMETGKFDKLPGVVYAIGFSRTYATYLGLNPDVVVKILQSSADFYGQQGGTATPLVSDKESSILTPKLTVAISVVLVFSIVFALSYFMKQKQVTPNIEPTSASQSTEFDDDLMG